MVAFGRHREAAEVVLAGLPSPNATLATSFQALADRIYPSRRHNGDEWLDSDTERAKNSGNVMQMGALLLQIKGDWPELCAFRVPDLAIKR